MKTQSIWLNYSDESPIKRLNADETIDVAIIGGGMTGMSVAYQLRDKHLRISLFERNLIGHGVTARTTAKITYLQENILLKIANIYNEDTAYLYYKAQKEAMRIIKNIVNKEHIDCDFRRVNSYVYTNDEREVANIKRQRELLLKFKEKVKEATILPDEKHLYGIMVSNTYVFHPLKYLYGLKKILQDSVAIYENSQVIKIDHKDDYYWLSVNDHLVKAKKVILCTHYPSFLFPYVMPLKCSLEKSYIGLYRDDTDNDYSAITNNKPTTSIRYLYDNGLKYKLVLKNAHNICVKNNELANFKELGNINSLKYLWSNIDIITKDYLPLIGPIDEDLYLATGYNTWGMTNATIAGKVMANIIMKRNDKYQKLFDPLRKDNLQTFLKYPLHIASSALAYTTSKINKNKKWYDENVIFKKINGLNVGIYIDKEGNEHKVLNKCPHLGCSLIFNSVEKTWDCPCHGSRFDIDGKCISGPSNFDIHF